MTAMASPIETTVSTTSGDTFFTSGSHIHKRSETQLSAPVKQQSQHSPVDQAQFQRLSRSNSSSLKTADSVGSRRGHSPVVVDLTRIDVELHTSGGVAAPDTPVPTPPPPPGTSKHIQNGAEIKPRKSSKKKLQVFGKRPKISAPELGKLPSQTSQVLSSPSSTSGVIGPGVDVTHSNPLSSVRNSTSSLNGCRTNVKAQLPLESTSSGTRIRNDETPLNKFWRLLWPESRSVHGGLRSKKLKPLIHPLDRSIVGIFTLTIFFTVLAILTGAPIVLLLFIILPVGVFVERLFLCKWNNSSAASAESEDIPTPFSPIDLYWFVTGAVTHCVLYIDKGLSAEQLRDVVASRLLTRPELNRFRSSVVMRGLWGTPHWSVPSMVDEALDFHIVERPPIASKHALRERLIKLMSTPLPADKPMWQIEYATADYCPQVVLIVRVHQTLSQSGLVSVLTHYLADSAPTGPPLNTATRARFGGATLSINIFRAIIVGPLTFSLWIIWAFTRRRNNHLTTTKQIQSIHWCSFDLAKIVKIKQITRSTLNDVLFSVIAGSVRSCLSARTPIANPPDLTVSLPIDIRPSSPLSASLAGVNYVLTTSPLPTNTEGAIPRLWEVRHLMEELKTSADTAVMYGAHYLFSKLLPRPVYRYMINLVNRNSSLYISNIQGPSPGALSIGSHRLRKAFYFLSAPSYCAITYNILTLNDRLYLSISTRAKLLPNARDLTRHFGQQIELLSQLLARRRVPGESKRARQQQVCARHPPPAQTTANQFQSQQYFESGAYFQQQLDHQLSVHHPSHSPQQQPPQHPHLQVPDESEFENSSNLSAKLHEIQDELNRLSQAYEMNEPGVVAHYELLKSQFTSLLHQMRRRKSIADYGQSIMINIEDEDEEDDDNDGELRPPPRRFSVVSIGRRGSIVPNIPGSSRVTPPIHARRTTPSSTAAGSGHSHNSASPEPPSSPDMYKSETEC